MPLTNQLTASWCLLVWTLPEFFLLLLHLTNHPYPSSLSSNVTSLDPHHLPSFPKINSYLLQTPSVICSLFDYTTYLTSRTWCLRLILPWQIRVFLKVQNHELFFSESVWSIVHLLKHDTLSLNVCWTHAMLSNKVTYLIHIVSIPNLCFLDLGVWTFCLI